MDQHTEPDQHGRPKWVVIYEDERIIQEYNAEEALVIQRNKNNPAILPVIYKRKINPAWVEAGKHPHGTLAINEHSFDQIKIGPTPQ